MSHCFLETMSVCTKLIDRTRSAYWTNSSVSSICWSAGCAWWKSQGSVKSGGFIFWWPCTSVYGKPSRICHNVSLCTKIKSLCTTLILIYCTAFILIFYGEKFCKIYRRLYSLHYTFIHCSVLYCAWQDTVLSNLTSQFMMSQI